MDDFYPDQGRPARVPALTPQISPALALSRQELDIQISTARQFPRNIPSVIGNITMLATLDEETAQECLYALVRGKKRNKRNNQQGDASPPADDRDNKPIEGPSIRLAEIAAQCYGNCRIDARVIEVNRAEKYVEAEGVFHDLESNMASRATVRRRISTSSGYLFSDDMIVVTGNAACAIAKRNAILAGIPKGLYRPAYQQARAMVAGTVETLASNRDKAIKSFTRFGVTAVQILETLGLESEDEITVDHIATLRAMYATLKNGEANVEEMFSKGVQEFQRSTNPLADQLPGGGISSAGSGFGETSPAAGAGGSSPPSPAPTSSPATGPRGHTAAFAEADEIRGEGGEVLKSATGPVEAGEKREDLAGYRRAGFEAGRLGKAKTLPKDLRGDDNAEAADAWLEGHDEGRAQGREG
jgi:hypothetical protein